MFQWSINKDLFFVTQVFPLSPAPQLHNYLGMKRAVVLLPSLAGSWLPATEQGLRELMCLFSLPAAGLSAVVKWTLEARG